jgi:hypothetical protein
MTSKFSDWLGREYELPADKQHPGLLEELSRELLQQLERGRLAGGLMIYQAAERMLQQSLDDTDTALARLHEGAGTLYAHQQQLQDQLQLDAEARPVQQDALAWMLSAQLEIQQAAEELEDWREKLPLLIGKNRGSMQGKQQQLLGTGSPRARGGLAAGVVASPAAAPWGGQVQVQAQARAAAAQQPGVHSQPGPGSMQVEQQQEQWGQHQQQQRGQQPGVGSPPDAAQAWDRDQAHGLAAAAASGAGRTQRQPKRKQRSSGTEATTSASGEQLQQPSSSGAIAAASEGEQQQAAQPKRRGGRPRRRPPPPPPQQEQQQQQQQHSQQQHASQPEAAQEVGTASDGQQQALEARPAKRTTRSISAAANGAGRVEMRMAGMVAAGDQAAILFVE